MKGSIDHIQLWLVALLVLFASLNSELHAQHDYLIDETYGDGGEKIINWSFFDIARRGDIDANDRALIVCSDHGQYLPHTTVIRLDTDGQFDQTFAVADGFPGAFSYQPDSTVFTEWPELCLTASGKIVVANGVGVLQPNQQVHQAVHVFRLNDDGSLDQSFGTDGVLIIEGYEDSSFIVEDAIGNLYISCYNYVADNIFESGVVKVSQYGTISVFDFADQVLESVTTAYVSMDIHRLIVEDDQLLIFARGIPPHPFIEGSISSNERELVVFRVDMITEEPDLSFGSNGVFFFPEWIVGASFFSFQDAVILGNGDMLMLVSATYYPSRLIKLNGDGQIVSSYGENGNLDLEFLGSPCNQFRRFAKHPSNGWYITSSNVFCGPSSSASLSIAQLNELGEPILMQNHYGSIEVGSYFDNSSFTTSVQSDGKLVVTGFFFNNGPPDLKATRINTQLISSVAESQHPSATPRLNTYPNPASHYLRVNLDLPEQAAQSGAIELVMHDLNGREVYRQNHPEVRNSEITIDVSAIKAGIYMLHCTVNGVWVDAEKVVVQ